jgi:hypothetical protein
MHSYLGFVIFDLYSFVLILRIIVIDTYPLLVIMFVIYMIYFCSFMEVYIEIKSEGNVFVLYINIIDSLKII